jgi:hypothetical protein
MEWKGCYLWAINDMNIFGDKGHHVYDDSVEEFITLIKDATVEFEIEDDVWEGYYVKIDSFSITL